MWLLFRTVEWKNLQAEFAEATRRCDIPEVAASGQGGTALQPGSVLAMVSKPACLKCYNVLHGRPMMSKPSFRPVSTSRGAAVPTQSLLPRPPFKRARADGTFLHPEWRHSDRGALQWAQRAASLPLIAKVWQCSLHSETNCNNMQEYAHLKRSLGLGEFF